MSKTQFLSNIYFYFTIHILMCKSCETYNVKKKLKCPSLSSSFFLLWTKKYSIKYFEFKS